MTLILALALLVQDDFDTKLDKLVEQLASDNVQSRSEAADDLAALVKKHPKVARKALRKRIDAEKDANVRAALKDALTLLPVLKLTFSVDGDAKVGQLVKFKVRIRNISDEAVLVVRSLDGSGRGARFPKYTSEFLDADKKPAKFPGVGFCGNCNQIKKDDFIKLEPGKEFDPFGKGAFGNWWLQSWKPDKAGTFTVKIVVDYSAKDAGQWNGGLERMSGMPGDVQDLIKRVPKLALEKKIEVEVRE